MSKINVTFDNHRIGIGLPKNVLPEKLDILEYKMKTVKVRIKCIVCGKFDKTIDVDENEHGYFSVSDAYCPECLCIMKQIWDHHKKEE